MKKKGFTLVELLVVIAIIALLMSILMPALARVRQLAYRMLCGTNLSGIGKAMLVYANDNNERYPRAGGRRSLWDNNGAISDWDAMMESIAFGGGSRGGATATISSSHYLLVKYADVSPKQFVCKGDSGTTIFDLSDQPVDPSADLTSVWDFGLIPTDHCSYTYHMPYYNQDLGTTYAISMVSNPVSPVASDKSPFQDLNADYCDQTSYNLYVQLLQLEGSASDITQWTFVDPYRDASPPPPDNSPFGNSASHQREGQNVLYVDGHVTFERHPNVGVENDNIWLHWTSIVNGKPATQQARQVGDGSCSGGVPMRGQSYPWGPEDAFLVNDLPSICE